MKCILAIFCWWAISTAFSQSDTIRFYRLEELTNCNPDTVYSISLEKSKLDHLPEELFRFKSLKHLHLGKNKFTEINGLDRFPDLVYLNVERNDLVKFPVGVCQMAKLEVLILNRNSIDYVPGCIDYCTNLRYIDFWYTAVTELPESMQKLAKLETMDFSGVRMNPAGQEKLKAWFPKVQLILDPPCDCVK